MPARWGPQHWYVASVSVAGFCVLAWSLPRVSVQTAILAIVAVAVAELFAVTVREDMRVSLANIVIFVVFVVASPEAAVVGTLGMVIAVLALASDQLLLRVCFNTFQFALSAAAGGSVYAWMLAVLDTTFPSALGLVAVMVGTMTYTLVNQTLVAGIVSASSPDPFWSTLWSTLPAFAVQVPSAFALAVLASLLLLQSPWAILFIAVPVLVARYALMAFQQLDRSYDELVRGFVTAIEMKDLYTRGHSERVSQLSVLVAEELGIAYDQRRLTGYAALLHDVGKVGVPLCIINKAGPLDDDEFEEIKKHPTIGAEVLRDIDFLEPAIDIVRYHHERLDGKGYPHGVGEEQLPDIVRIVTAVDAFDAMTSTRSYRRALTVDDAVAELRRCAGRQFDTRMVEALARAVVRVGWQPTTDFASEEQLHGRDIPTGAAQERQVAQRATGAEVRP